MADNAETTQAAAAPEAAPGAFGVPIFRSVWLASMASNFGGLVQSVGAAWLMTSLSGSAHDVALVQASVVLPIMLFSLPAGAMADNLNRRYVMLAAQFTMLLVSVALALGAWQGLMTPALLLTATFLIGCGTAFNNPAWQASVGDMVPRKTLPQAIALNSMGFNLARTVGPAIGGAIVATAGAAAAFVTNAFSYLPLLFVLARWRPDTPPRTLPRERLGLAIFAGLRFVSMSPNIKRVLFRSGIFGFAASTVPALMPLIARDLIGGGPITYGILLGAFGLGAVAAALGTGWCRQHLSTEWMVRGGALMISVGAAATSASTGLWFTVPALLLAGGGWVLALTTFNVSVQMSAPRWVVARALATYQMWVFGGMAAGSWTFGLVAEDFGVASALLVAAFAQLLVGLFGFLRPLPQLEELDLDPLNRWQEPQTAVPVEARSGPVVITVEYRIADVNHAEFLSLMSERRRMRRRDGARRWTLLRDLAEADLWIERFHLPTWQDYVRTSHRATQADAEVVDRIRALLLDGSAPTVRRMLERQPSALPASRSARPHELADPLLDPNGVG